METQQRIQQAQEKALELRQAREQEANELHRDQLESEREGTWWWLLLNILYLILLNVFNG
jgi:hypothetical protein